MGKKLYIGNLAYAVSDADLASMFSPVGTVESAKVITDRMSGRSKGFGFVEMATDEQANEAIERMNGKEQDGRALTVSEARPQAPRESGGFGGGRNDNRSGGFGRRSY